MGVRQAASQGPCAPALGVPPGVAMASAKSTPSCAPRCTEVVIAVDPTMDARAIKAETEAKKKAEAEAAAVEAVWALLARALRKREGRFGGMYK